MKSLTKALISSAALLLFSISANAALITVEGLWTGEQGLNATSTMQIDTSLITSDGVDLNGTCGPCTTTTAPGWVSNFSITIGADNFTQAQFSTIFLDLDDAFVLDYASEFVAQSAFVDFNFFAAPGSPSGTAPNEFSYQGVLFNLVSLTPTAAVPEPGTATLLTLALAGLFLRRKA